MECGCRVGVSRPRKHACECAQAEAAKEGEEGGPAWGWGVRGWDGPASTLGPRGQGSAGGVEGEGLMPSMPPQLKHYVLVVDPRHKVCAAAHSPGRSCPQTSPPLG